MRGALPLPSPSEKDPTRKENSEILNERRDRTYSDSFRFRHLYIYSILLPIELGIRADAASIFPERSILFPRVKDILHSGNGLFGALGILLSPLLSLRGSHGICGFCDTRRRHPRAHPSRVASHLDKKPGETGIVSKDRAKWATNTVLSCSQLITFLSLSLFLSAVFPSCASDSRARSRVRYSPRSLADLLFHLSRSPPAPPRPQKTMFREFRSILHRFIYCARVSASRNESVMSDHRCRNISENNCGCVRPHMCTRICLCFIKDTPSIVIKSESLSRILARPALSTRTFLPFVFQLTGAVSHRPPAGNRSRVQSQPRHRVSVWKKKLHNNYIELRYKLC